MAAKRDMVKCVPNFCEGSDERVIGAIAEAISSHPRCTILDIDRGGKDRNRTIYTFVGPKSTVVQAALDAAHVAFDMIDMQKHKPGNHPRIGALDICPFVPLKNDEREMKDCVALAKDFGAKLAENFGVPVYFYEHAQDKEHRKTVNQIRDKEYEGLEEQLWKTEWKPDCGPCKFVPNWGATITGARYPLITFNVNILGTKEQALKIVHKIRGKTSGQGEFNTVKACAYFMAEHKLSQVCMSLTDYKTDSIHTVFDACCKEAKALKVAVVGSEVHGLVPLDAILLAADHYTGEDNVLVLDESQKIRLVVDRLRLSSISEFKPEEKILEYKMKWTEDGPLLSSSVRQFLESIAYSRVTPGVGCATTTVASLGVGLCTMVGLLSAEGEDFVGLKKAIEPLHSNLQELLTLIDEDTAAVEAYMKSQDLPRKDQKIFDQENIESLRKMCTVPLKVMDCASRCWPHVEVIAELGNPVITVNVVEIGAQVLDNAIQMTAKIVLGNLKGIQDKYYCDAVRTKVNDFTHSSARCLERVLKKCS